MRINNITTRTLKHRLFSLIASILAIPIVSIAIMLSNASAQPTSPVPKVQGLVNNVYVMPYVTISGNFHSGQAFPKSASGLGYGFGISFDLTQDGQKSGFLFDFAYQDMRASAQDGMCMNIHPNDTLLATVPADHYFQYFLLETFLKLQGAKNNGYFLLGASFGYQTYALTVARGPITQQYSRWEGTDFNNPFRLDLRAGLGVIIGEIGGHKLIFEGRIGYPITTALSNYTNICNGTGTSGSWKIITAQGNLGLRF